MKAVAAHESGRGSASVMQAALWRTASYNSMGAHCRWRHTTDCHHITPDPPRPTRLTISVPPLRSISPRPRQQRALPKSRA